MKIKVPVILEHEDYKNVTLIILYFFDDDIIPTTNCLEEVYKAIIHDINHNNDDITGYVGLSILIRVGYNATNAIHIAQTTYFWEISTHLPWSPWGVTAFLVCKWKPNMKFDEDFPKTGGGEDIAFCIEHLEGDKKKIKSIPTAEIVHPWWDNRKRIKLWIRLVKWAIGDGILIDKFPQFTYSALPNIFEFISFWWPFFLLCKYSLFYQRQSFSKTSFEIIIEFIMLIISECIAGTLFVYINSIEPNIKGIVKLFSTLESNVARNSSEFGHWYGHLKRKKFINIILSKRFDWFLNTLPNRDTKYYEYKRSILHLSFFMIVLSINMYLCYGV